MTFRRILLLILTGLCPAFAGFSDNCRDTIPLRGARYCFGQISNVLRAIIGADNVALNSLLRP